MSDEIKYGYCHCGCGEKTTIPKNDHSTLGYKKGVPLKFIYGHQARGKNNSMWKGGKRKRTDGYVYILVPEHPRSSRNYVMEHILIAENALGKRLPIKSQVHHIDNNRSNNNNNNLIVCENDEYHKLLHIRTNALRESGNPNHRKCTYCKTYDSLKNLFINSQGKVYHRLCEREYRRKLKENKK